MILGSSTFVPFMQLSAKDRRDVIEDLLDIKIFSAMSEVIKTKLRLYRDETRTLELKKDSLVDKVKMQKDFIDQIEKSSKEDIRQKKESLKKIAEEASGYIHGNIKLTEELDDFQKVLKGLKILTKLFVNLEHFVPRYTKSQRRLVKNVTFMKKMRFAPPVLNLLKKSFV